MSVHNCQVPSVEPVPSAALSSSAYVTPLIVNALVWDAVAPDGKSTPKRNRRPVVADLTRILKVYVCPPLTVTGLNTPLVGVPGVQNNEYDPV